VGAAAVFRLFRVFRLVGLRAWGIYARVVACSQSERGVGHGYRVWSDSCGSLRRGLGGDGMSRGPFDQAHPFWAIIDASYTRAEQIAIALWADSMEELQARNDRRGWSRRV
jgi:hypothetical protein